MRRLDAGLILATLGALPALVPLARPGFFVSDDGMFHLYRLMGLDAAMHAGVFFPRLFPDFAFGYGYPVLNFYSPLSYYLGMFFHWLGADYIAALKMTFGAALLLSVWTMYAFAREWLPRPAALLAALAYLYAPYHLGNVYQRGALAESLAYVFFPLLLWLCHRLVARREAIYALGLAMAYAGLILTHNLSALLFSPVLVAYGVFRWLVVSGRWLVVSGQWLVVSGQWLEGRGQESGVRFGIWGLGLALLFGFALAAFYIVPVVAESSAAHLSYDFNGTGYQRHLAPLDGIFSPFLMYRYFPNQGVSAERPLGLAQTILLLCSLVIIFQARHPQSPISNLQSPISNLQPPISNLQSFLAFCWLGVLGALAMTLQLSLPLWQVVQPILSMIQYPWRFMTLVDLFTALLIGSLLLWRASTRTARRVAISLIIGALLAANALPNAPRETLDLRADQVTVQRMWQDDYAIEQIGATWTAEYLPLTVKEERWAIPRPTDAVETADAVDARVVVTAHSLLAYDLMVESASGFPLRLHAFHFPGWNAYVDDVRASTYPSGRLGLVTVDVPASKHRVRVAFEDTPPRQIGALISMFALIVWLGALGIVRRRAAIGLGIVALILMVLVAWHLYPFTFSIQPTARVAHLEDKVQLAGYHVGSTLKPGDTIPVTLYWFARAPLVKNYKVFVHLADEDGMVRAQHDGDPVYGFTPTTRWMPGELIVDRHDLVLPADLSPGRYTLLAGLYDFETLQNLIPTDEDSRALGNRVRLGSLVVK
jgi:hypothetical protein